MYDVVVIGGGVGGLATGALLCKKGFKTLLLEQSTTLGGRANSIAYKSGYIVDWGIHLLRFGDRRVAEQVFKMLGDKLEVLEPGEEKLFHEGRRLELPTKADVLRRTPLLDNEDKKAAGILLAKIIGTPLEKVLDTSVAHWLKDVGGSVPLDGIMRLTSKLCITTHSPADLSAGEVFTVISGALRAGKSVGYPKGGWKTIIEKLLAIIAAQGGQVKTCTKAEKIVVDDNRRASAVIAEGARIEAENVVCAAPCQHLHNIVSEDDLGHEFLKSATFVTPTSRVAVDFGLLEKVSSLNGIVAVDDPFILGQFTSNIDSSVAPSGEQLATFLSVLPPEEVSNRNLVEHSFEILETLVLKMFFLK